MSSETKVYNNGPDQIILEASDLCNSNPDGAVKIRDHDPQSLVSDPPISVPSILERTAKKYPDHPALCVKRDGAWVEWTYKQVIKLDGLPQGKRGGQLNASHSPQLNKSVYDGVFSSL